MNGKPRAECVLEIPDFGSDAVSTITPWIVECRHTRNNHLEADTLEVTLDLDQCNVDPRILASARIAFWMWDDAVSDQPLKPSFVGIVTKSRRTADEAKMCVVLEARDYTTLFLECKHFPSQGLPQWHDNLRQAWERLCDNTGFYDVDQGIVSSVAALRNRIEFRGFDDRELGTAVSPRLRAVSLPVPPNASADAWKVWQGLCSELGVMSFIEGDTCVCTVADSYYDEANPLILDYGTNLLELEENSDPTLASKAILLKSFDHLTGRTLEAIYPGTRERVKHKRGVASAVSAATSDVEQYDTPWITDQLTLDREAKRAYEERKRQELQGRLKTCETTLMTSKGEVVPIFDLRAGDSLQVTLSDQVAEPRDPTKPIPKELTPIYHAGVITLSLGPDSFQVEMSFHNLIRTA